MQGFAQSLEIHPSGAKAHVGFMGLIGTAEAVPFQNRVFPRLAGLREALWPYRHGWAIAGTLS
jgi:hypothetical protein